MTAAAARGFTHIEFGVASRSDGHSALKRMAYQIADRTRHALGVSDFRRDRAEHVATIMLAPEGAPAWTADPRQTWQRATAAEGVRANAQECRIGEISIPRELPREFWQPFAEAVLAPLAHDGMVVQADIHAPTAADGSGLQPHIHWMATMRRLDSSTESGFSKGKAREWNEQFAAFGGGKVKGDKAAVKSARATFAERMTAFCQANGLDLAFDARTSAEQGLDREAEPAVDHWKFKAHRHGRTQVDVVDLAEFRRARAEAEAANAAAAELAAELAALPPEAPRASIATAGDQRAEERRDAFRRRMTTADDRRQSGRAAALKEAYQFDGWLPADAARNISRIGLDRQSGAVHLLLLDGTRIRDDGTRVALAGPLTDQAAEELVAAAQRRGWTTVELTGTAEFKNAMALRLALAEPPVAVTNHELPAALQAQIEAKLARRAADQQQPPTPPPRPEAAAAAWLRGRAADRRRVADELDRDRRNVVEHGGRFDRPTNDALFALTNAERALADHRSTGRPAGVLAKITGQATAWDEEEQRLDAARAKAQAELERLRDEKRRAHELADREARPRQRQAEEYRLRAAALERVAQAARRGDPRACAVAARQDDEAALRLAEQLRRKHEQEERRRRTQREAELARQRQQDQRGPTPGPAPGPRRR